MLVNKSIVSSARGPPSGVLRFWGHTDGMSAESGPHLHTLMTSYGVGGSFLDWVLEGNLAGFLGCVFEVRPAPGARKGLQTCFGASPRGASFKFLWAVAPLPRIGVQQVRAPPSLSHTHDPLKVRRTILFEASG
jgi:hypothetical protein